MPIFRVVVKETHFRESEIEADSMDDARERAKEEDWSKWAIHNGDYEGETEIVDVVYVADGPRKRKRARA